MEMVEQGELIQWLKLSNVNGLGPSKSLKLLSIFGSVSAISAASDDELLRTKIFNENMVFEWNKLKNASDENFEKMLELCRQYNITVLPIYSDKYPFRLKTLPSPPVTLFLQGDVTLLHAPSVAIVGSRESDERAQKWAYETAKELAYKDIVIVSGGAKGIDWNAHRGALDGGGKTICVFGTGLFKPYPEEHIPLYDEILHNGLLVSEHSPNFPGSKIGLLQRNRITSGLSNAMVQVTSGESGGSWTQMSIAASQHTPLFCPPLELNFYPSEGIKLKKAEYGIRELNNLSEVIAETKKDSVHQNQGTLNRY